MAKTERICILLLRLMAFGATLSATIVVATSHERANSFAASFEAKYSDMPAFKFFVAANAIVSICGFLVLFLPPEILLWRLVVVTDTVFTMLITSSISADLSVAQVGKKGYPSAGWLPVCGQVPKYCDQITAALAACFIGVFVYLLLLLYSIHTVLNPLLVQKA